MSKFVILKATGIISAAVLSAILFIQIQLMMRNENAEQIPSYFYIITQVFAIAIFLLAVGCILKGMSGVGVVFTGYQIFILASLIQGIPPFPLIIIFILSSLLFLEASQALSFISEVCEPILPNSTTIAERERVKIYIGWISTTNTQVHINLETGKIVNLHTDLIRIFTIWTTIIITLLLAILFIGNDALSYIALIFFVMFPLSIIALVIQKRTIEKEGDDT